MRAMMLVVSAIAFSSSAQGQVNDVTERLINPWYYCVGQATGRQPDRFRSPEESVERAFIACQTEEMAVRSYAGVATTSADQCDHREASARPEALLGFEARQELTRRARQTLICMGVILVVALAIEMLK